MEEEEEQGSVTFSLTAISEFMSPPTSCPCPALRPSSCKATSRSTTQGAVSRASGSWSQHSASMEQKTLMPCRTYRRTCETQTEQKDQQVQKVAEPPGSHLVLCPGCGEVGPPSVPQNQVPHGVHTGLVTHL